MKITDELLDKIADLSKLSFQPEERDSYKAEFQKMLEFVDQLQSLDTTGVQPLVHITEEINHLREDRAQPSLPTQEALQQAPQQASDHFLVPKVVNKA